MEIALLLGIFLALLFAGVPVALAMLIASIINIFHIGCRRSQ